MGPEPPLAPGTTAEFDVLERETVHAVFELQPGFAVFLGAHEYDGHLPDFTRPSTDRWVAQARNLHRRLEGLSGDSLSPSRRFDRTLLQLLIESALFDLEDVRELDRNPMAYLGQVSLTPYLVREYAPREHRVAAMVNLLRAAPPLLDSGVARLEPRVPLPYVQLALTIAEGLPTHLKEAAAFASQVGANEHRSFSEAEGPAQEAIDRFSRSLRQEFLPRATPDFALGPERYQRLLWVREGIRRPYSEILAQGWADLKRNQARLKEIAAGRNPPISETQLLESMFRRHVQAQDLIPKAQELVAEVRGFVEAKGLVSVPPDAVCRVEETPSYGRALSTASMNPPGPFDEGGSEGIYYVTPVDSAWTPAQQEEWLRMFNNATLRNTTVHEVFPGHYVQFLHFRAASTSLTRKTYISSAFTEGWAHYAEQVAVESGISSQEPDAEAAQLTDALLRDCRLIASIGLHTQGMTVAAAAKLFHDEAHLEDLPSQREAIRGTFNPEYFCYTLGKLAILDLRRKWLNEKFGGAIGRFHDHLLGYGAPPVGLLETLFQQAG